ncbi:MAG: branched-chain amino acid ABC transporter substrate-binding protein [Aggregatilineales bacterium]
MGKLKLSTISKVGVAAMAAALMAIGYSGPAAAQASVKIAIMGPFTGPVAAIGTEQLNFAKLAVDDFNKASGMSVQLVQVDTQLDAAKAVTGAQSVLSNTDIVGVVGPAGSQEVEAISPLFDPANVAFISPSATRPSLTESGVKSFFRVVPRDDVQGPTDATFMVNTLKAKNVYLIDDQTSYSTGLADAAQATLKGLNVTTERDSITQKDTDFSALVTRLKGASPDVVFVPFQLASQAAQIAKQMQEQGVKAVVFGGDGVFSPDDFIRNAAGATEGAYVSLFAPDIHGIASSKAVVDAYTKQYGSFGSFGGPSYAATTVLLEAVQRASKAGTVTRAAVLAEVAKTNDATSVLGIPIKFDAKGDIVGASFYIYQVQGANFVLVPGTASTTPSATMAATMAATASQ